MTKLQPDCFYLGIYFYLPQQLNGEPRSYTRFNLTENMEGDNSQVEMKLSSDMDEEVGGNGVGDHLNHNSERSPYVARKPGRTPKNICFMAATTLLIFIIGKGRCLDDYADIRRFGKCVGTRNESWSSSFIVEVKCFSVVLNRM